MAEMVVTNLRIEQNDWIRLKTLAAEANMSANEYINWLLDISLSKISLGHGKKPQKSIYDLLPHILTKKGKVKPSSLSKDDETIYG